MLPSLVMLNSFSLLPLTKMATLLSQCSMVVIVVLCLELYVLWCASHSSVLLNEMTSNLDQCTMQGRKRSLFHNNRVGRLTRHDLFHSCLASGWCWFPTPVACQAYLSPLKGTTSNPGQCPMSVMMTETWPSFIPVTLQSKHAWEASDDDYDNNISVGLVVVKKCKLVIFLFNHSSSVWCD